MKSLTEIQEAFSHDRFATNQANIRIVSAQPDFAVCEMPITPEHLNARGTVMGGAIFTLADFTAAVAANSLCTVHQHDFSARGYFLLKSGKGDKTDRNGAVH